MRRNGKMFAAGFGRNAPEAVADTIVEAIKAMPTASAGLWARMWG